MYTPLLLLLLLVFPASTLAQWIMVNGKPSTITPEVIELMSRADNATKEQEEARKAAESKLRKSLATMEAVLKNPKTKAAEIVGVKAACIIAALELSRSMENASRAVLDAETAQRENLERVIDSGKEPNPDQDFFMWWLRATEKTRIKIPPEFVGVMTKADIAIQIALRIKAGTTDMEEFEKSEKR